MNNNRELVYAMIGAGRATELHMNALRRYSEIPICYKWIMARREEQLIPAQRKYGFLNATYCYEEVINDSEVDIIDICTPPYCHEEMIEKAMKAGKNVICEKPLSGYFGMPSDKEPIGDCVSKVVMYERLLKNIERLRNTVENSTGKFMYAENFVYAPSVKKAAEILEKKGSRILYAKGEESLKGSSSPVAGEWAKTGGGTFIRTGTHPLTAILWLKQVEARTRGIEITVDNVFADMGRITPTLSEYEHRHIAAYPHDVEDHGTVIITFSDGSKATIIATDVLLGGSKNYIELYCNDTAITCKLTMSDMMSTYFLDEESLDDVSISEMLPSKMGWNNVFLEDEIIRGYTDEMRDFVESVYFNRDPQSGFDLAFSSLQLVYAAYKSAEIGKAVKL